MKLIIELTLWCPKCGARHIDETRNGERWDRRAHTTHRCQKCSYDFDVYVSGAQPDAAPTMDLISADTKRDKIRHLAEHIGACWAGRANTQSHPNYAGEWIAKQVLDELAALTKP